ncbi:MAG: hypothetical protein NVSMB47_00400 [Polyangiales bacterium]
MRRPLVAWLSIALTACASGAGSGEGATDAIVFGDADVGSAAADAQADGQTDSDVARDGAPDDVTVDSPADVAADALPSLPAPGTLADYWAGAAAWKLRRALTLSGTGWPYGYGAGAHVEVVDGHWYLFSRQLHGADKPAYCAGLTDITFSTEVRRSDDQGKTWTAPTAILANAPGRRGSARPPTETPGTTRRRSAGITCFNASRAAAAGMAVTPAATASTRSASTPPPTRTRCCTAAICGPGSASTPARAA